MAKELRKQGKNPEEYAIGEADWVETDTSLDVMLNADDPQDPEPEPEEEPDIPMVPPDFPEQGNEEDQRFGIGEYWVHYFTEASPFGEEPEEIPEAQENPARTDKQAVKPRTSQPAATEKGQPDKQWRALFSRLHKQNRKRVVAEEAVPAPKAKRAGRRILVAASIGLGVLIAGMVVIAEPWVPATPDDYVEPSAQILGERIALEVGQSAPLSVPLGENEQIVSAVSSDVDVLNCADNFVTAIGEWDDVTVTITTQEKEIPEPELKPFKIFGIDMTGAYNSLRTGLRDFLGIEENPQLRTEPRMLNIYQVQYCIQGYYTKNMPTVINLYTNDRYSMILDIPEGMEVQFECENGVVSVDQGSMEDDEIFGYIACSGQTTGQGKLMIRFGFIKEDNFVTTGALVYQVQVIAPPDEGEEATFASGSYNGTIPI